jgi:hypothetical protein
MVFLVIMSGACCFLAAHMLEKKILINDNPLVGVVLWCFVLSAGSVANIMLFTHAFKTLSIKEDKLRNY